MSTLLNTTTAHPRRAIGAPLQHHRRSAFAMQHLWLRLAAWACGLVAVLAAGCGGSSSWPQPPAGLSFAMTSAVYELGQPIAANRPSVSGGAVDRYSVAPALPAGLAIDAATGVISGTPTAVSPHAVYTVTAVNLGGSATARLEIEVRQTPAAPAGLTYRELAPVYTVGQAVAPPNTPSSSGGPIDRYVVAPALPAGLSIDAQTGEIGGTPAAASAAADYLVTGTNAAGSATVTLRLAVQQAVAAPASLVYDRPVALYVTTEPITPNAAHVTGGPASAFSVSPALPAGLSLNATTGVIAGTPTAIQPQATYTVTASNNAGSAQAQLKIEVTGRGSWSFMPALPEPKFYAGAVKVSQGRLLVFGGRTALGVTASAALYEPATDEWALAAYMLVGRAEPLAVRLADGRVLVAGGNVAGGATASSAELYDPGANTWTATGSMVRPRTGASATLLPNGKVLVVGGLDQTGSPIVFHDTAELYDPATGTWTLLPARLSTGRAQHGAQLLPDHSAVLLIGGIDGTQLTSAELYPASGSGSTTVMPGVVPGGTVYLAVRLADDSILGVTESTTAVRFHPATASWSTSNLASGSSRLLPTLTALADGRALLAGGGNLGTAEIYNPGDNTWTVATPMSAPRNRASAVAMDDGSVMVIGGMAGAAGTPTVERFAP